MLGIKSVAEELATGPAYRPLLKAGLTVSLAVVNGYRCSEAFLNCELVRPLGMSKSWISPN